MVSKDPSRSSSTTTTTTSTTGFVVRESSGNSTTHNSSNNSNGSKDPLSYLARGYTSRLLTPLLSSLRADDIDKDLRHFQAYDQAIAHFRQVAHQQQKQHHHHLHPTAPHARTALPIKIDPDEEKRQQVLRAKILKAEVQREALESQYVALRAHYVHVSHDLQDVQAHSVIPFLHTLVRHTSQAVALRRCQLQMVRDMASILLARACVPGRRGIHVSPAATAAAAAWTAYPFSVHDPLLEAWQQVEEQLHQAVHACHGCGSDGKASPGADKVKPTSSAAVTVVTANAAAAASTGSNNSSGGSTNNNATNSAVMKWPATQWKATPSGVPLLVSALSKLPEKTVALGLPGIYDSKPDSLVWLEEVMPVSVNESVNEGEDEMEDDEEHASKLEEEVKDLQAEMVSLQSELQKERMANQQLTSQMGATRHEQDEWVAMMALLRYETEHVLHRYNVVLESDYGMYAVSQWQPPDEDDDLMLAVDDTGGAESQPLPRHHHLHHDTDVFPSVVDTTGATSLTAARNDEANDGDDEGSINDDDEGGAWASNEKRPMDGELSHPRKKQRKS
jgi:hypothetical protein